MRAPEQALRERIARAYGVNQFGRIHALRFTFHVHRQETDIARSWEWEPRTQRVTFTGNDADGTHLAYTYFRNRMQAGNPALNERLDRWFINDQYWLLFPFHIQWDALTQITTDGMAELPISPGWAEHLVVAYPKTGGYTPGDRYELFVDPDGYIQQWAYHKGGAPAPTLVATWTQHVHVGPIVVSLEHRSADGSVRVWFTDVAVKLAGTRAWLLPSAPAAAD